MEKKRHSPPITKFLAGNPPPPPHPKPAGGGGGLCPPLHQICRRGNPGMMNI